MDRAITVGALRESGYQNRSVKKEIRENLLARLEANEAAFPGILGFEDTVLPQLESALLAGHDFVLLGERGQGKTRLMRTLASLLDEWSPVVAGCEINDDPFAPVCVRCLRLAAELGDQLPVAWRHRDDRYVEKLATPDTSVGDLVGDVDPVKVAEGRTLGDPETIHFGLLPRSNRGVFGINELPDLAERIQVAMFNVLEERDIQVRGYSLRLPLDVIVVATANPEDYTNRGRIITPLKDRFGAEIRTHYPYEVTDEVAVIEQESHFVAEVPEHLLEVVARLTRGLRSSSAVDQRSGVSARFAIAAAEAIAGSALRRGARVGEPDPVARICDVPTVLPTLLGKVQFEMGEEGREVEVVEHLLKVATAETFRERLTGIDLSGFTELFAEGGTVETGELVPAADLLEQIGAVPGLSKVLDRLGHGDAATAGQVASAVELVLEGLHLARRIDKAAVGGRAVYGGLTMPRGRFRYSPWSGGPDPLAPPYDVRAALDELGADVLAGGSLREALRDLMRRGLDGRRGTDALAERIRRLRAAARRRGDLGGTLDQVRAALDQALAAERDTLASEDSEAARWNELELATLPDDIAGTVRALDDYDWHSDDARATFESIRQMLQREALDAQFSGLRQALESGDAEAMNAVKDMLADLNALLAAHARGEDTTDRFREFMDKHGDLFPEKPESVDELIDALARRQAAADRMMASLSAEQRNQLAQLMSDALSDPDLASQMAQLADNLRALRPGQERGPVRMRQGGEPLGYSDAVGVVAELADLEALERQLAQTHAGATLDDVDVELLERHLGASAAGDFRALRELEQEMERQGFLSRGDDGLRLTPRAVRRLGETALKRVFAQIEASGSGDHDDHRTGSADEPTGLTREWTFGDELPIDAVRTVSNALRRGAGVPARLSVDDFEVVETERRTSAAVALCVDLSYSMVQEGRWGPMKQTALALSHLISTRFRRDALEIIGFNLSAGRLSPLQLAEVEPEWVQGTNLQHALMIATRHLRRHPDAEPVVLVVTDGEPTAHLLDDGTPYFHWPPTSQTLRATVAQVDDLTRFGAALNIFMLGDDPGLARFVDAVARRAGGRVLTPDLSRLGEYVVSDYLRARRGRR